MLPRASGPSQSRMASQEVIRGRKGRKGKSTQPSQPVNLDNHLQSPISDDNFLPDLVPLSPARYARKVVTPNMDNATIEPITPLISLVSPPAINRMLHPPPKQHSESNESIPNLNDLQSTLEFTNGPIVGSEAGKYQAVPDTTMPDLIDREVVTVPDTQTEGRMCTFTDSLPNQCSTPKHNELYPNSRICKVATNMENNVDQTLNTVSVSVSKTPIHQDETSQTLSSPRSVIIEPDQQELDTANTLIQMRNSSMDLTEITTNYVIDRVHELPVDSERLEDVVKELNKSRKDQKDSSDSDATVEYLNQTPEKNNNQNSTEKLPKGHINYKHYGIKRQSLKESKTRNYRCYFCEAICHSKQQLNRHHKSEHARVKCPTCKKQFPMPDALQRHRYSH